MAKINEVPNYKVPNTTFIQSVVAFLIGMLLGFMIMYIFYKIAVLSIVAGVIFGIVNIYLSKKNSVTKRVAQLRTQFMNLLEAMVVAMRSGNPPLKALESARKDLLLIYSEKSDIIVELDIIISKFNNAIPLSVSLTEFAERCGLEDVYNFASVYKTIEGKSSRVDEIITENQKIIADKMEIEIEIETLMTAAKSEAYIMLFMPLVIILIIGYAGAGFMDSLYTTPLGRCTATFGFIVFIISYFLTRKFSQIQL